MSKKSPASRVVKLKPETRSTLPSWHNGADVEIHLYAQSLQKAGRALVGKLELDRNTRADWDACPVLLLYRETLELHLKLLVGEGSNFLKVRTDPITLYRTHSLRWLAQIVCQIIKAVGWEAEFKCESVATLAEFNALVSELDALDPVTRAVHSSGTGGKDSVSKFYRTFDVVDFAKRMDALLVLLDVTADALAATWDQQAEGMGEFHGGDNVKPTIH